MTKKIFPVLTFILILSGCSVQKTHNLKAENYQVRYPNEHIMRRGVMSPNRDMTEDDFITLKEWNVNLIRFQIVRNWGKKNTELDLVEYDIWLDSRLKNLAQALDWAEKYGMKIVIDLHSPPGGRMAGEEMRMFHEEKYAAHFIECWRRIAQRFNGDTRIWGYDLLNEPVQSKAAIYDCYSLQRLAALAIREIDSDTMIILEVNNWAVPWSFKDLQPLDMDNITYQLHMYIPVEYTHAGAYDYKPGSIYPGEHGGKNYDREELRKNLQSARDFQLRHGARIFVGEFSATNFALGAERYITDCISIFEEYNWDWTFHAFREWEGWSVEHTVDADNKLIPAEDTPRKRALLEGLKNNSRKDK